jgi:hypothetical protein
MNALQESEKLTGTQHERKEEGDFIVVFYNLPLMRFVDIH